MMSTRSSHDGRAGMPGRRGWMPRWLSIPLIGLLALVGSGVAPRDGRAERALAYFGLTVLVRLTSAAMLSCSACSDGSLA